MVSLFICFNANPQATNLWMWCFHLVERKLTFWERLCQLTITFLDMVPPTRSEV